MNPDITVVVPYYNEKESIEYTLERVGCQTLPAKVAIFVNSSSTDGSYEIINNWIQRNQHRFPTQFLNLFENTDNPASSKNAGIRAAKTEWVAFMDCGQHFEETWLEQQFQFATKNNVDVVSGVVYLVGENWVDRCAVAQTYGYKRNRPCLPTTLVRKSVFNRTGLLLEGRRAGYDVAWPIKLNKLGIKRGINEEVKIQYAGFNFSSNLKHLFKKSILYAKPTVAIEGYLMPCIYVIFPMVVLGAFAASGKLALFLVALYFAARIIFLPAAKSRNICFYREHPFESLFGLGVVGFVIDLGRMIGVLRGIRHYYFPVAGSSAAAE